MNSVMNRLSPSATTMIRMDHTHVLASFHQYATDSRPQTKRALANAICLALEIHAQLEEEIFYPALREAIDTPGLLDEAQAEHQLARELIARIESMKQDGSAMDELVSQLARVVEQHVKEERDHLFPKARAADALDLDELGAKLKERQQQLEAQVASGRAGREP